MSEAAASQFAPAEIPHSSAPRSASRISRPTPRARHTARRFAALPPAPVEDVLREDLCAQGRRVPVPREEREHARRAAQSRRPRAVRKASGYATASPLAVGTKLDAGPGASRVPEPPRIEHGVPRDRETTPEHGDPDGRYGPSWPRSVIGASLSAVRAETGKGFSGAGEVVAVTPPGGRKGPEKGLRVT
ncbi:predicted protein [Streptomyces sp. SPB78]|nr:predicted protein [Streptomyces sp. SPB78]